MILHSAPMPAPNPRRVRVVAAEKGIVLTEVMLDLRARDQKTTAHLARNSLGQVPVLELEDGTMISETIAICRYLDVIQPDPPLFGRTPVEIAIIEMWIRRIEIQIGEPIKMFWRHAHPATAALIEQHTIFGESNRAIVARSIRWLEKEMADDRPFVAGRFYSMADIVLLTLLDFARFIGLEPPAEDSHLRSWHRRILTRASTV